MEFAMNITYNPEQTSKANKEDATNFYYLNTQHAKLH